MKLEELLKIASLSSYPADREQSHNLQETLRSIGLDPNNLYQELEMSDPFAQVHRDTSYSNAILSLHSHSFYEILCCKNTCPVEYLVGAERYRLQKGDIVLVPPGVSHRPLLPENLPEPYVRDVLWLNPNFAQLMARQFPDFSGFIPKYTLLRTAGTKWAVLEDLLHSAVRESEQQKPGWNVVAMGYILSFIAHLRRAFKSEGAVPLPAEKPDLLEQVMAYIEENLSSRITLAETARHFYVSTSTVSHLFQKKMGVSFYHCVTQRRLIAAKQLIIRKYSLESVAEQTGFSDYSAFYRAFKKEFGISPRQFSQL